MDREFIFIRYKNKRYPRASEKEKKIYNLGFIKIKIICALK